MKFKKIVALFGLAALLLTSCASAPDSNQNGESEQGKEKITICLDAGHGVGDVGAVSPFAGGDGKEIYEKDINYALVLIIKEDLEAMGYNVILPRGGDDEEPVAGYDENGKSGIVQRVKFANKNKYDLYISIHCNSFSDENVSGTRLYYNKDNNGKKNKKLVGSISEAIEAKFSVEPKTYDNADLYAVTATKMPACLIEIGFITNRDDLDKMLDNSWREDFADALSVGISNYLK